MTFNPNRKNGTNFFLNQVPNINTPIPVNIYIQHYGLQYLVEHGESSVPASSSTYSNHLVTVALVATLNGETPVNNIALSLIFFLFFCVHDIYVDK